MTGRNSSISRSARVGLREPAQPLFLQGCRDVIQVEGDDQIGATLDGGSQNMAVVRVWSFQGWNQGLIASCRAMAAYGHRPYNDKVALLCAMSPVETALHAAIEAIDEPRSARMDQRTKPSVKASIEAAADLMGIEASAFVVMSAYARAQELLSGRQQTLLSQGDHQALLAALDDETTPTPALLEAWQLHQDQVVHS